MNELTATARPVHALVLTGFGINCEEELAAAYRLAGGVATIVHFNDVLHGRVSIHDYDVLNFPGGFSFGDDLGSGVVMANKARFRQLPSGRTLLAEIRAFIDNGGYVVGICNGFQMLVKMGLLPDFGGRQEREVTLTHNASGRYEDRWVRLAVNPNNRSPFLRGLTSLEVPVRHGEGRLVIRDAEIRRQILEQGLNCLTYCDAAGSETEVYPHNPNGAELNCAGLTDTTGQVFGLMPHPEAFLSLYNHPDWARRKRIDPSLSEEGDGLRLFRNIVAHVAAGRPHPPAPSPVGRGSLTTAEGPFVWTFTPERTPPYGGGAGGGVERPRTLHEDVFTTSTKRWEVAKDLARSMRHRPTEAEDALWQALRGQKVGGMKFRRQHAIDAFIVDFFCPEKQLVVEVDGGVHAEPGQAAYDAGRTDELERRGFRVIRFTNQQVLQDLPAVLHSIEQQLQASS